MYRDIIIHSGMSEQEQFELLSQFPPGYSPGYVAAYLGISRQAVDQAVRKGALVAFRTFSIDEQGKKSHTSTHIDPDSMEEYKQARRSRKRVPQGFKATQQRLFG